MTIQEARTLALTFEEAIESPHFEKPSFRVNKKIFLTLDEKMKRACINLHEEDQHAFHSMMPEVIFPVPNKWGQQGWTLIELTKIKKPIFRDALTCSYCKVAPRKLSEKHLKA